MSSHSPSTPRGELERDLETLTEMRAHISQLMGLYRKRQEQLLGATSARMDRAIVIIGLISSGARLRWGVRGWQIEGSHIHVPCDIVRTLDLTGLIESDEGVVRWAGSERAFQSTGSPLEDLLCDDWSRDFDRVSRLMFKYQQEVALLGRISELRSVYKMAEIGVPRDYFRRLRSRIKWWAAIAGLYFAVVLNLFAGSSTYRRNVACRSLSAIEELIPGALHEL